tara:strand:- start:794 stop:1195 length:402 start_codon:yes stop_codon:yes gene_type:complete
MEEGEVPDWVSSEDKPESEVVLEGSPNVTQEAPQQIYVQGGQYGGPGAIFPTTNAVLALVLSILGIVMCSICTALPGLIVANGALATTTQYPGHPDQGMAKAAQIISWIGIGLFVLLVLFYGGLFALIFAAEA